MPKHLLYSIFARIGGSGLDTDAFETLRASYRGGFLGRAIAYDNRQTEIPARAHPFAALAPGAAAFRFSTAPTITARRRNISTGSRRDISRPGATIFSTAGRAIACNRCASAQETGIPSIVEIPTWHRDRGKVRRPPAPTPSPGSAWRKRWKENLLQTAGTISSRNTIWPTLLFVLSQKAADTFRVQGFPEEKLFYLPRGVDVERFKPGARPPIFRAVFSGALIERKGIHHLLEAWHRLDLKDAELWLVGSVHDEAKPHLKKYWRDNIKVVGFKRDVGELSEPGDGPRFPVAMRRQRQGHLRSRRLRAAADHDARSGRRGRTTACEGIIVPPGNVGELAAAILQLYRHPEIVERMSAAARQRVVENFTWDHFRTRLLIAYENAMRMRR